MRKGEAWILLSILPVISSLPGPVKMGLEDMVMEMVLCEQLDGACKTLTQENLEPVVMKLEKAVEAKELNIGNYLYEELETRVGRLLCGLDYNQFCTEEVLGRTSFKEESALCRIEGINCKSKGRTDLGGILSSKKELIRTVLSGGPESNEEASADNDGEANTESSGESSAESDEDANAEISGESSGESEPDSNAEIEEYVLLESLEDVLKTVIDSNVAAVNAVVDVTNDIADAAFTGVGILGGNLANVANEIGDAKSVLSKSSVKAAKIAAEGVGNLTRAAVKGALDVEIAKVEASVNMVNSVVEAKTSIFKSVFNLLKTKINIVLCKINVKCSDSGAEEAPKDNEAPATPDEATAEEAPATADEAPATTEEVTSTADEALATAEGVPATADEVQATADEAPATAEEVQPQ